MSGGGIIIGEERLKCLVVNDPVGPADVLVVRFGNTSGNCTLESRHGP